jgi:hypothetical protein
MLVKISHQGSKLGVKVGFYERGAPPEEIFHNISAPFKSPIHIHFR